MTQKKMPQLLTLLCLSSSAFAATSYVSDDLFTYTHKGPGTQYKILGLVHAGEKLNVLSTNKDQGYTEIKDKKGRSVWINSEHVSHQPGLKTQLERLQSKYSKLDEKLRISEEKANENKTNLEEKLNENANQVLKLKELNASLSSELEKIQAENISLTDTVDNEKNELIMRWFTYGGGVAGIGLLVGLLLPALIPSRKKRSSW